MSLILTFRNTSALAPVSNYDYRVLIGDGGPTSHLIASGTLTGHARADGWKALVQRLLDTPDGAKKTPS